jgi:ATP-dependent DNA helicase PIF1
MSPLYKYFKKFKLGQNMRTDPTEIEFSEYILKLGEGREDNIQEINESSVKIPDKYLVPDMNTLIEKVFPNLEKKAAEPASLIEGTIYTPLNKNMKKVNFICITRFPGQKKIYLSNDTIMQEDQKDAIPIEFLNTLTPSGIPDNELVLKLGAPVMLLRNLQAGPKCSLRNGTRMIVRQLMERIVECEVAVGIAKGTRVFLPRIPMYDRSNEFPFTLVRRQFPLRLAFAVTINKGQGQENQRVGIYLPEPVFAHGQLYTAFSRGKRGENVSVFIEDNKEGFTDNIVYRELI